MAVGWSRAVRGEARSSADFARAAPYMRGVGKQWVNEVSSALVREMTKGMPADTGYSRGHLGILKYDQAQGAHVGVLGLTGKNGESLDYLALMNRPQGIERHFVSFTDPDGRIRQAFVNWARRHGFAVYRSAVSGKAVKSGKSGGVANTLKMGGLTVWGYSRPWATNAFVTVSRIAREMLTGLKAQFGKVVG